MVVKLTYKKLLIVACLVLLPLFFTYRIFFNGPQSIDRIASTLLYPFIIMQHTCSETISSFFHKRASVAQMKIQLTQLQEEKDSLLASNIELHSVIEFAQDTQELRDFRNRYQCDFALVAQVIARNFSDLAHFFLIDKGSVSGVALDMVVIYKNCLIGRVSEVYPYYSKILLVTDRTCNVAAACTQSKASGIYQGTNQKWSASLKHISHLCPVEIGELIISSGDGLIFPRGFGLGKIKSLKTHGLFHTIDVEPLVDIHAIQHLYIVKKGALLLSPVDHKEFTI
jgi:rod shape-determining protein MreC